MSPTPATGQATCPVGCKRPRSAAAPTAVARRAPQPVPGDERSRDPAVLDAFGIDVERRALPERCARPGRDRGTQAYGAAEDDVTTRQVAGTIAKHLDVTAASIPAGRADEHFGGFADIMRLDFLPMTSAETRTLLGWTPTQPGLLADLDEGHYFASPAERG